MSIAEKITQYRKKRGLTQETLGEALGVTGQAISKWEVGSTMPDLSLLPRLCELLDVPPDVLLEIPRETQIRYLKKNLSAYISDVPEHRGRETTSLLLDMVGTTIGNEGYNYDGNNLRMGEDSIRLRLQRAYADPEHRDDRHDEVAFLTNGDKIQSDYLSVLPSSLGVFLDLFRSDNTFAILRETKVQSAVTIAELEEKTSIPSEELHSILLNLLEMGILAVRVDRAGKRGYMRDAGFAAVMMVLAAADACACIGGPGINAVWLM